LSYALEQGSKDILSNRKKNVIHIHIIFAIPPHMAITVDAQPPDRRQVDWIPYIDQIIKPDAFFHLNGIVVQDLSVVSVGQPLRKPMKLFDFFRLVGYSLPDKTIKDVTRQEDRANHLPKLSKDLIQPIFVTIIFKRRKIAGENVGLGHCRNKKLE
jgi:hypothetical protein